MRIEALIFDIGNVLVTFDWQPFRNKLQAGCLNLTADAEKEFRELSSRFEVGEMTGEMQISVLRRFGTTWPIMRTLKGVLPKLGLNFRGS